MAVSVEHLTLPAGDDLDILLVGTTGHGKSATGNSILRRNEFESSDGPTSVTKGPSVGCSKIDRRVLRVVDTPGFVDTEELSDEKSTKIVKDAIIDSLTECPQGFDAIVLVQNCKLRFTKSDIEKVDFWMRMIGEDNFMSHGIIVLTGGDSLGIDNNDPEWINKKWWMKLSVDNQLILEKCGRRCVVFDNISTNFLVSRTQLFNLITKIHNLPNKSRCVPKCCKFSKEEEEKIKQAERTVVKNISEFSKKFLLLENSVNDLGPGDDRLEVIDQITKDIENMKRQMMEKDNESIYEAVKDKLIDFEKNLSKLKYLHELPSSENLNKKHLCNLLSKIQNELKVVKKNTVYWETVRNNIELFFDYFPFVLGSGAIALGVALAIPGVNMIAGSTMAGFGVFNLLVGGFQFLKKKFTKNSEEDKDTPTEK